VARAGGISELDRTLRRGAKLVGRRACRPCLQSCQLEHARRLELRGKHVPATPKAQAGEVGEVGIQALEQGLRLPDVDHPAALVTEPVDPRRLGNRARRRQVALRITIPWVAIGGIDADNAAAVTQAGASGIAAVRAVGGAADPEVATRRLREAIGPSEYDAIRAVKLMAGKIADAIVEGRTETESGTGGDDDAKPAVVAAAAAADQDKFWKFHDALFLDQKKLDPDNLKQTAAKVGLDRGKFNACFSSDRQDAGIRKDMEEGNALGVTGTPTFFINGRELVGAQPAPKFNEVINEELARAKASNSRQAMR